MTRILSNYAKLVDDKGKEYSCGLLPALIAEQMFKMIDVAMGRIGYEIFCVSKTNEIRWLKKNTDLFGWLGEQNITIIWMDGPGRVTKSEFTAYLAGVLPCYDMIRTRIHEPKITGVFYSGCHDYGDRYTGALDALVDSWNPKTHIDRSLIKAAFVTIFWGGAPGTRPAFSIESDDEEDGNGRGVGKSVLLQSISRLAGGSIDCSLNEDVGKIKTRILSDSGDKTVVAFDNCKTSKLSSGDLEGLITAPVISGHQLYKGNGQIPNYMMYLFSMNNSNMSADMVERSIRIVISRHQRNDHWGEVAPFIDDNYAAIVGDCVAILRQPCVEQTDHIRFRAWQDGVLAKVDPDALVIDTIKSRQTAANGDDHEADDIVEAFEASIQNYSFWGVGILIPLDPKIHNVLVTRPVTADWIRQRWDRKTGDGAISHMINRAKVKEITQAKIKGQRFWKWNAPGGAPGAPVHFKITSKNTREALQPQYSQGKGQPLYDEEPLNLLPLKSNK